MMRMTRDGEMHWRVFNFLGRIVGIGFVLTGSIFVVRGVSLLSDVKAAVPVDGLPSADRRDKVMILVVGVVVAILGVLLLAARRYRPDLSERAFRRREKKVVLKSTFP